MMPPAVPGLGPAPDSVAAGKGPAWLQGVRVVLEGLRDAVVATDDVGTILYVNKAGEDLLGWPRGTLVGRPVFDLVPDSLTAAVGEDYGSFVRSQASNMVGRPLDVDIKRADGTDVRTELVISIFEHPIAGPVVVGIIRIRFAGSPSSRMATPRIFVCRPWPISVPPWFTCAEPSE